MTPVDTVAHLNESPSPPPKPTSDQTSPIEKLPVEILAEVFHHGLAISTVLPVCKQWYRIATSTPTLWDSIYFNPCSVPLRSLQLYLKRSKRAPLSLSLHLKHSVRLHTGSHWKDGTPETEAPLKTGAAAITAACVSVSHDACAALRPHLNRIRDFSYSGPLNLLFPLSATPLMRSIQIICYGPYPEQETRPVPCIFQYSPPLLQKFVVKHLYTNAVGNMLSHVPAGQIRHLELMRLSTIDGSLEFVQQCTQLRSMTIATPPDELFRSPVAHGQPLVDLLTVTSLAVSWSLFGLYTRVASLPNVVHLELDDSGGSAPPFSEAAITEWPSFGRLKTLRLRLRGAHIEYLIPTLERCPELLGMHIEGNSGFCHLLRSLLCCEEKRRDGSGLEESTRTFLSPKLKLLRMQAVDTVIGRDASGGESFERVWPLLQLLLQQRPDVVAWLWTIGLMDVWPSLWEAEEVKALTAHHPFAERLCLVGKSDAGDFDDPYPYPLNHLFPESDNNE